MKLTTFTFAATLFMASMASAQSTVDSVRAQLAAQGYTVTEVNLTGNTYTIEAFGNGQHREITYNALTGEILLDDVRRETNKERQERVAAAAIGQDSDDTNGSDDGRGPSNDDNTGSNDDRGHSDDNHNGSDDDRGHSDDDHNGSDDDRGHSNDDRNGSDDDRGHSDDDRNGPDDD